DVAAESPATTEAATRPVSRDATTSAQRADTAELREFLRHHPGGDDIQVVYDRLAKNKSGDVKGEFETTEEYRVRMASKGGTHSTALRSGPLAFAFELGPKTLGGSCVYDADAGSFRIKIALDNIYPDDKPHPAIQLQLRGSNQGSYIGSNAMGARVNVERMHI